MRREVAAGWNSSPGSYETKANVNFYTSSLTAITRQHDVPADVHRVLQAVQAHHQDVRQQCLLELVMPPQASCAEMHCAGAHSVGLP